MRAISQLLRLSNRLGMIIRIIQILGFSAFFVYIGLYIHYGYTLDTVSNKTAGEIYPLNLHGHMVYLSRLQHLRLEVSGALALFFGAIFATVASIGLYQQRKRGRI